jgi:hypothetical protein
LAYVSAALLKAFAVNSAAYREDDHELQALREQLDAIEKNAWLHVVGYGCPDHAAVSFAVVMLTAGLDHSRWFGSITEVCAARSAPIRLASRPSTTGQPGSICVFYTRYDIISILTSFSCATIENPTRSKAAA